MIQVTVQEPAGRGAVKRTVVELPDKADIVQVLAAASKHGRTLVGEEDAARERAHEEVWYWRRFDEAQKAQPEKGEARETYVPPPTPPKPDLFAPTVGVRQTSVEAYRKMERSGKLTAQQEVVVAWMRGRIGDATRQEISKGTELPINAVSGRVHELVELGVLRETRRRKCRVTQENVNALVVA